MFLVIVVASYRMPDFAAFRLAYSNNLQDIADVNFQMFSDIYFQTVRFRNWDLSARPGVTISDVTKGNSEQY